MYKRELISRVASLMRENNLRKPVSVPKQAFHISDDEGNTKDFVIKRRDKNVLYTVDDVEAVIDSCVAVIEDALRNGEPITLKGFGTLSLKYRKPRATKIPCTEEWVTVDGRYIPKFDFGNSLRRCAQLYEASLNDMEINKPMPIFEDSQDDETDGD